MTLKKFRWSSVSSLPISLEAIRTLHQPASAYRVEERSYPPGTYFHGTSVAGRVYVLDGVFEVALDNNPDYFSEGCAGEYIEKPGGAYRARVSSPSGARTVTALEIPPKYRRS